MYTLAKKNYTSFELLFEFVIEYSVFYILNQWVFVKFTFRYVVVLIIILWIIDFRFWKNFSRFFARRFFLFAIAIFLFSIMLFCFFVVCNIFWADFMHWLIKIEKFNCFRKRYNFFIWQDNKAFFIWFCYWILFWFRISRFCLLRLCFSILLR